MYCIHDSCTAVVVKPSIFSHSTSETCLRLVTSTKRNPRRGQLRGFRETPGRRPAFLMNTKPGSTPSPMTNNHSLAQPSEKGAKQGKSPLAVMPLRFICVEDRIPLQLHCIQRGERLKDWELLAYDFIRYRCNTNNGEQQSARCKRTYRRQPKHQPHDTTRFTFGPETRGSTPDPPKQHQQPVSLYSL